MEVDYTKLHFYAWQDLLAIPYLYLFFFLAQKIVDRNSNNLLYKKYYMQGLKYKMIGSFGFYCIYCFYYHGGDSTSFFTIGKIMNTYLLTQDFSDGLKVIFSSQSGREFFPGYIINQCEFNYDVGYLLRDTASLFPARISAIVSIFCFNSYLCTGLLFGFASYLALFRVFVLFCNLYPACYKDLSFAFLKIPSVMFWGSNINKDTICMALVCLFIIMVYESFIKLRPTIGRLILMGICVFFIFNIKSYIIIAAVPGLLIWVFLNAQNNLFGGGVKAITTPIVLVIAGLSIAALFQTMSEKFEAISVDALTSKAEGAQSWHSEVQAMNGGSGYSLDMTDFSTSSVISKAPIAIALTLFGPFPWQVRNPVMLLSSLEGIYFFYLMVISLSKPGSILRLRNITNEPVILFCLIFTLILGISVGMTSYNFGALVRYKIPILPFCCAFFFILRTPLKNAR